MSHETLHYGASALSHLNTSNMSLSNANHETDSSFEADVGGGNNSSTSSCHGGISISSDHHHLHHHLQHSPGGGSNGVVSTLVGSPSSSSSGAHCSGVGSAGGGSSGAAATTTSSLRQWRKKDAMDLLPHGGTTKHGGAGGGGGVATDILLSSGAGGGGSGEQQQQVQTIARVAPHTHHPRGTAVTPANNAGGGAGGGSVVGGMVGAGAAEHHMYSRYQPQFSEYSYQTVGAASLPQPTPVKYSEIVEPSALVASHHLGSAGVLSKHPHHHHIHPNKEHLSATSKASPPGNADYHVDMCSNLQQQQQSQHQSQHSSSQHQQPAHAQQLQHHHHHQQQQQHQQSSVSAQQQQSQYSMMKSTAPYGSSTSYHHQHSSHHQAAAVAPPHHHQLNQYAMASKEPSHMSPGAGTYASPYYKVPTASRHHQYPVSPDSSAAAQRSNGATNTGYHSAAADGHNFLAQLNKIDPQMAQSIINDPHLRATDPPYHHPGAYAAAAAAANSQRIYSRTASSSMYHPQHQKVAPMMSYSSSGAAQSYSKSMSTAAAAAGDPYSAVRMHFYHQQNAGKYHQPMSEHGMIPYKLPPQQHSHAPPHAHMDRNISPRRYNEMMQLNYGLSPAPKISPTYSPTVSQTSPTQQQTRDAAEAAAAASARLEYAQHYQNRAAQSLHSHHMPPPPQHHHPHHQLPPEYIAQQMGAMRPANSYLPPDHPHHPHHHHHLVDMVREDATGKSLHSNLKSYLESWNDEEQNGVPNGVDAAAAAAVSMQVPAAAEVIKPTPQRSGEDLYVLDSTEIPTESVTQYLHVPQIDKLPDNIKFYPEAAGGAAGNSPGEQILNLTQHGSKTNSPEEQVLPEYSPSCLQTSEIKRNFSNFETAVVSVASKPHEYLSLPQILEDSTADSGAVSDLSLSTFLTQDNECSIERVDLTKDEDSNNSNSAAPGGVTGSVIVSNVTVKAEVKTTSPGRSLPSITDEEDSPKDLHGLLAEDKSGEESKDMPEISIPDSPKINEDTQRLLDMLENKSPAADDDDANMSVDDSTKPASDKTDAKNDSGFLDVSIEKGEPMEITQEDKDAILNSCISNPAASKSKASEPDVSKSSCALNRVPQVLSISEHAAPSEDAVLVTGDVRTDQSSIILEICDEVIEINVTITGGRKIISVVALSDCTVIAENNNNRYNAVEEQVEPAERTEAVEHVQEESKGDGDPDESIDANNDNPKVCKDIPITECEDSSQKLEECFKSPEITDEPEVQNETETAAESLQDQEDKHSVVEDNLCDDPEVISETLDDVRSPAHSKEPNNSEMQTVHPKTGDDNTKKATNVNELNGSHDQVALDDHDNLNRDSSNDCNQRDRVENEKEETKAAIDSNIQNEEDPHEKQDEGAAKKTFDSETSQNAICNEESKDQNKEMIDTDNCENLKQDDINVTENITDYQDNRHLEDQCDAENNEVANVEDTGSRSEVVNDTTSKIQNDSDAQIDDPQSITDQDVANSECRGIEVNKDQKSEEIVDKTDCQEPSTSESNVEGIPNSDVPQAIANLENSQNSQSHYVDDNIPTTEITSDKDHCDSECEKTSRLSDKVEEIESNSVDEDNEANVDQAQTTPATANLQSISNDCNKHFKDKCDLEDNSQCADSSDLNADVDIKSNSGNIDNVVELEESEVNAKQEIDPSPIISDQNVKKDDGNPVCKESFKAEGTTYEDSSELEDCKEDVDIEASKEDPKIDSELTTRTELNEEHEDSSNNVACSEANDEPLQQVDEKCSIELENHVPVVADTAEYQDHNDRINPLSNSDELINLKQSEINEDSIGQENEPTKDGAQCSENFEDQSSLDTNNEALNLVMRESEDSIRLECEIEEPKSNTAEHLVTTASVNVECASEEPEIVENVTVVDENISEEQLYINSNTIETSETVIISEEEICTVEVEVEISSSEDDKTEDCAYPQEEPIETTEDTITEAVVTELEVTTVEVTVETDDKVLEEDCEESLICEQDTQILTKSASASDLSANDLTLNQLENILEGTDETVVEFTEDQIIEAEVVIFSDGNDDSIENEIVLLHSETCDNAPYTLIEENENQNDECLNLPEVTENVECDGAAVQSESETPVMKDDIFIDKKMEDDVQPCDQSKEDSHHTVEYDEIVEPKPIKVPHSQVEVLKSSESSTTEPLQNNTNTKFESERVKFAKFQTRRRSDSNSPLKKKPKMDPELFKPDEHKRRDNSSIKSEERSKEKRSRKSRKKESREEQKKPERRKSVSFSETVVTIKSTEMPEKKIVEDLPKKCKAGKSLQKSSTENGCSKAPACGDDSRNCVPKELTVLKSADVKITPSRVVIEFGSPQGPPTPKYNLRKEINSPRKYNKFSKTKTIFDATTETSKPRPLKVKTKAQLKEPILIEFPIDDPVNQIEHIISEKITLESKEKFVNTSAPVIVDSNSVPSPSHKERASVTAIPAADKDDDCSKRRLSLQEYKRKRHISELSDNINSERDFLCGGSRSPSLCANPEPPEDYVPQPASHTVREKTPPFAAASSSRSYQSSTSDADESSSARSSAGKVFDTIELQIPLRYSKTKSPWCSASDQSLWSNAKDLIANCSTSNQYRLIKRYRNGETLTADEMANIQDILKSKKVTDHSRSRPVIDCNEFGIKSFTSTTTTRLNFDIASDITIPRSVINKPVMKPIIDVNDLLKPTPPVAVPVPEPKPSLEEPPPKQIQSKSEAAEPVFKKLQAELMESSEAASKPRKASKPIVDRPRGDLAKKRNVYEISTKPSSSPPSADTTTTASVRDPSSPGNEQSGLKLHLRKVPATGNNSSDSTSEPVTEERRTRKRFRNLYTAVTESSDDTSEPEAVSSSDAAVAASSVASNNNGGGAYSVICSGNKAGLPKIIIKRTNSGPSRESSTSPSQQLATTHLQPVVRLERMRQLDAVATQSTKRKKRH